MRERKGVQPLSAQKRDSFMRMIEDAMAGKIDRILCKSVSRFSRNSGECRKYVALLTNKNVTVEFEKEHCSTDEAGSSFIFSVMSLMSETESRSISQNVRWSNQERVKRGEYNLGNNRILGYDSVDGKLVPNVDAETVRLIYQSFLEGKTLEEIRRLVSEEGVLTKKGNPISTGNIMYILTNETYKGDKFLQKTPPRDMLTKRPDHFAKYESNYLEGDHEAIVTPELWDAVQLKIAENRKMGEKVGHRGGQPHFLYGKVFCTCGNPMTRRTVNGIGGEKCKTWICREQRKRGFTCMNRKVKEDALLAEINQQMGWQEFDEGLFEEQVERVTVREHGVEIERTRQEMPA